MASQTQESEAPAAEAGGTGQSDSATPATQSTPSASSSQPRNDYAAFREMLKHPSALPLTARLQDFVRRFPEGLSREKAADRIHKFLSSTQDWMLSEVVVFAADADEEGQLNAQEGLEKFLLSRMHARIFGIEQSDHAEDETLKQRIDSLSWVTLNHLGIPPVDTSLLDLAVEQLQQIDKFKAPRDKLVCILNSCRVINDVLKRAIDDSGSSGRPLSADDFLPLMIFSLILANPPRLHSNTEFVAAFRHPSRLVAEDAYFLTALQSAAAFVKDASPKALEVSEEDFKHLCETSLAEKGYSPDGSKPAQGDEPRPAATAAAKGLELQPEQRTALAARVADLPMRFEGVQSVRHLKVGDMATLLEEYREMAKLLREVQQDALPEKS